MTVSTVDEYLATFPPDVRDKLEGVRAAMRRAAPETEERISYGIPTITLDDRYVMYFAGWKRHISVYPIPAVDEALDHEIEPYKAGKGTLKFPLDRPIPFDLIERLVAIEMEKRR